MRSFALFLATVFIVLVVSTVAVAERKSPLAAEPNNQKQNDPILDVRTNVLVNLEGI